ncbi:hypothetical protein VIGAN_07178200 [Vigna angularis var. angularis]|uniref:Prohibitin n=1 Tax=Vigna angularis var. angularis TaxID=157739 RepID=A0A0S3SJ91_PHAAN|nr:hypothetical protein VIGAN_07178200 [Vigna angularis var. angularis]
MVGLVTTAGIASTVYTVDLGHTAVVFNGISKSTFCLNPGIHFLLPWIHTPHVFDVRATIHTLQSTFFTKDDKKISLQFHIVARPNVEHLPTLLNRRGFRYYEILLPTLNSGMNDLGKTYTLSQILEDEIIFSETIPSLLRENAHKNALGCRRDDGGGANLRGEEAEVAEGAGLSNEGDDVSKLYDDDEKADDE